MHIALLAMALSASTNFIFAQELPLYRETDHFTMLCLPTEYSAADEILDESEIFFDQLSHDLQHLYSTPIIIKMYHDVPTLHQAIDQPEAADWIVGELEEHAYTIVNPYNPGPEHSYESIVKANNVQLAELFIVDKYPHAEIPRWLHQGLALYLAHYMSDEAIEKFKNNATALPTLEELESVSTEDNERFAELNGFMASYLLVEFIDKAWNREKLLAVVEDYANFENILRYLKKDVEKHWMYHTFFTTHAFKSGDQSVMPLMKNLLVTYKKAVCTPYKNKFVPQLDEILSSFNEYKTKIIESNDHLLIVIQNKTDIAGWALFSAQSESHITLQALCIHPAYRGYDINKKLVNAVRKNFRTVKSITTVNKDINYKTPCFCGVFDHEKNKN